MSKQIIKHSDYQISNNKCGVIVEDGIYYAGSDIKVTEVKSALGEGNSSIGALCTSNKINKWAAYKPGYIFAESSGGVNYTYTYIPKTTPFLLGDFIGYNPNAKPPVHYHTPLPATYTLEQGDWAQIDIKLARGEMDAIAGGTDKNYVDVQLQYNAGPVQHNRISVPAVGSYETVTFYSQIIAAGDLIVKPVYYYDVGEGVYQDLAIIEDGERTVDITVTAAVLPFTGSCTPTLPSVFISPISVTFDWSLTNGTGVNKTIGARIKVYGTGIDTVYRTITLSEFTVNETKTGSETISIYATTFNTQIETFYELQIAKNYDTLFGLPFIVSSGSFTWTPEE